MARTALKWGAPEEVEFAIKPRLAPQIVKQALREGMLPAPILSDSVSGDNAGLQSSVRKYQL
jgi:SRSO17 transposase